jgi:predicted transcriptional regulator of viral defense system
MLNSAEKLVDLAKSRGLIRPSDLEAHGIPRVSLTRAVRRGELERLGRGVYGLPGRNVSSEGTLAEVAIRVPKGVVCLLSVQHHFTIFIFKLNNT